MCRNQSLFQGFLCFLDVPSLANTSSRLSGDTPWSFDAMRLAHLRPRTGHELKNQPIKMSDQHQPTRSCSEVIISDGLSPSTPSCRCISARNLLVIYRLTTNSQVISSPLLCAGAFPHILRSQRDLKSGLRKNGGSTLDVKCLMPHGLSVKTARF